MTRQLFFIFSLLCSVILTAQNRTELTLCLDSINQPIPSYTFEQLLQPFIPNNQQNGTIYLITNDGKAEKIVDLFSDPTIEPVCTNFSNLNEIGIDRDKNLVFARSNGFIFKVNEEDCTQIAGQTINANQTVYAMALDKNNSIYIDNATRNANTHSIFRSLFDQNSNRNLPFQPFITLTEGEPNGDMITLGKSIFSSWKYQGSFYLYEFLLDDNYNYTGVFYNWGRLTYQGISLDFFGMASEFGRLFGITNTNEIYEIVLNRENRTFENEFVLRRGDNRVKWIGAAGLNEATEYIFNFFYDQDLTQPIQFPLVANDPRLQGQKIYGSITDSNSGTTVIVTIDLNLVVRPTANTVDVQVCPQSDGSYTLDLSAYQEEIISDHSVTITFHLTESDAQTNQNAINPQVQFTTNRTYFVRVSNGNSCFSIGKINIQTQTSDSLFNDFTICTEPVLLEAPNGYLNYIWRKDGVVVGNNQTYLIDSTGNYEITVTTPEGCEFTSSFHVSDGEGPTITSVIVNGATATVFTPQNNVTYSIDGVNYTTSNVFTNLTENSYTIYVKDSNGCVSTTTIYLARNYNFISPNRDGKNDVLMIYGFQNSPSAYLKIYDRYGKVLIEGLANDILPWDGKINGKPLPSSSYWYQIVDYDKEILNGYIVLKNY